MSIYESINVLLVQRRQLERAIDRLEGRRLRAVGDDARLAGLYGELRAVEDSIRGRDLLRFAA